MVDPADQCEHGEHYRMCPLDVSGACRRGESFPAWMAEDLAPVDLTGTAPIVTTTTDPIPF